MGAAIYFNAKTHRKLYDYKVAQGWLCRGTEKESLYRHGGTDDDGKSAVPYRYHAVVILIEILCVLPFCVENVRFLGRNGDILYLCRGSIGNGMDSACVYQPQTAYGLQSGYAENQQVNSPDKKYTGEALLAMSSCNAAAWVMIAVQALIFNSLNAVVFYSYVVLESLRQAWHFWC